MNIEKVNQFLMFHGKYFPSEHLPYLKRTLSELSDESFDQLSLIEYKDPMTAIILSVLVGGLGIDRFYLGDVGLGIGKLLTGGGCGIWAFIDIFFIMGAAKQKNLECLMRVINLG